MQNFSLCPLEFHGYIGGRVGLRHPVDALQGLWGILARPVTLNPPQGIKMTLRQGS